MVEKNEKNFSMEGNLEKLEKYVENLEKEETSLDDAFRIFSKAEKISEQLQKKMAAYERKIELLKEKDNEVHLEPFSE